MKGKGFTHTSHPVHVNISKICWAPIDEDNSRHMLQIFVDNSPTPPPTTKTLKKLK